MDHTKIGTAYLDSPHQELSNGGLGIVVALPVRSGIDFVCVYAGVQSNCISETILVSTRYRAFQWNFVNPGLC